MQRQLTWSVRFQAPSTGSIQVWKARSSTIFFFLALLRSVEQGRSPSCYGKGWEHFFFLLFISQIILSTFIFPHRGKKKKPISQPFAQWQVDLGLAAILLSTHIPECCRCSPNQKPITEQQRLGCLISCQFNTIWEEKRICNWYPVRRVGQKQTSKHVPAENLQHWARTVGWTQRN